VLGIRPEDLHPVAHATAATIDARLEVVEPVGNEVFLNLRFGDLPLVVRMPPYELPSPGCVMHFASDPARLHFFDAAGGARLHG
jgi:multiple sugar transport system ATP-binding protein